MIEPSILGAGEGRVKRSVERSRRALRGTQRDRYTVEKMDACTNNFHTGLLNAVIASVRSAR
jgi:hypothetical protein